MRIMTEEIENVIKNNITGNIVHMQYVLAADRISSVVDGLRANNPDDKRTSYGIVHSIKVLSEFLFRHLAELNQPIFQIASQIYAKSCDFKGKAVGLGMLSYYGLQDYRKVLPHFESAASSSDWNMREISQMLFRKLIRKHPTEMKKFLMQLARSPDGYLRRFAAETLRPVSENSWIYSEPEYSLSILRRMFTEAHPYARTSVGNNLSDLAKKLPDLVYDLVKELVESGDKNSFWIAYRACRNLVKKEPDRVMDLLKVDEYKYKTRTHRRSGYKEE